MDGAALEVREMADDAVVADDRGVLRRAVHDRAVLDRGAVPDRDVAVVAPEDGLGPDGRVRRRS